MLNLWQSSGGLNMTDILYLLKYDAVQAADSEAPPLTPRTQQARRQSGRDLPSATVAQYG
jgi:hypothetical protein